MALHRSEFFKAIEAQGVALTYDDVRLDTGRSNVTAQAVDTSSRFSRNIGLGTPIVSAAMDTVTTADMAIAMAKLGGLGVIHAGLSPEEQQRQARKVKLHLNGKIEKPITVLPDQNLADVLAMCDERGFEFRSFPVVNHQNKLVGMLSKRDFNFGEPETKVSELMTSGEHLVTAPAKIGLKKAYELMRQHRRKDLPLIDKDGKIQGMYVLSDVMRLHDGNPERYNLDDKGHLCVAIAVPTDEGALERIELMADYIDVAVIDTAQGDSQFAFATLKQIKQRYPKLDVVVGNISNADSARALAEAGADGIKVGQGPGSICTTRIETGIGSPQISAVYNCVEAVKDFNIPVCADGGITKAGDISLAIAAGASSVMMGGGLAGTKESPGEVTMTDDNRMVKLYRGMGSPSALRDSAASRKRYGTEGSQGKPLSEGVEAHVTYKGPVADVMDHYIKALRKSMSYVGSKDIEQHRTKTRLIRITNAGYRESHPHDVTVI